MYKRQGTGCSYLSSSPRWSTTPSPPSHPLLPPPPSDADVIVSGAAEAVPSRAKVPLRSVATAVHPPHLRRLDCRPCFPLSFILDPKGLPPSGYCSTRGVPLPAGQAVRPGTEEVPSFRSALLVSRYTIWSSAHLPQGQGVWGILVRGGRCRAVFFEGAK